MRHKPRHVWQQHGKMKETKGKGTKSKWWKENKILDSLFVKSRYMVLLRHEKSPETDYIKWKTEAGQEARYKQGLYRGIKSYPETWFYTPTKKLNKSK